MSDLYKGLPQNYGGFDPSSIIGKSGSAGYYQLPMNLPFAQGRSTLATIPEFQRNPLALEKGLIIKLMEGRASMMKLLLEYAEANGTVEVNDVRFRLPVEVEPQARFYLDQQTVASGATTTIKVRGNRTKIATAHPNGNIKQVGDIARLEVGQFILLMFSWVDPRRTSQPKYSSVPMKNLPVPEIAKIVAIDYDKSTITVERNWAGEQRTSTPTAPAALTIVADTTTNPTAGSQLKQKYAFFLAMAKSMKEDEIDAKIRNYSGTWTYGILQRHLKAWGSQYFAELIRQNLGIESVHTKSRRDAIKEFYDDWEWTAIFGEKSEEFDSATGDWSGTTDGLLANIPKEHYVALKGIDWENISSVPFSVSGAPMGSFNPQIFNKIMENYGYIGSQDKVLLCGSGFHTAFATMINIMTQNVPEIKSEWAIRGNKFMSSNGLAIDVVPSDKLSLNGFRNSAILFDKQYFKPVKLKGYNTDIYELNNENPLKKNGFIHGVKGFIDTNPDAHWVFTIIEKSTYADGNNYANDGATWSNIDVLGTYLS